MRSGVLRRGLTVEALREFIIAQGSSSRTNLQEMEKLWALNKQIIDPIIPRYTAIETSKKVPFHLTNGTTHGTTRHDTPHTTHQ
jgi:glutamyl/glutaminyl-tRNA synthetase